MICQIQFIGKLMEFQNGDHDWIPKESANRCIWGKISSLPCLKMCLMNSQINNSTTKTDKIFEEENVLQLMSLIRIKLMNSSTAGRTQEDNYKHICLRDPQLMVQRRKSSSNIYRYYQLVSVIVYK